MIRNIGNANIQGLSVDLGLSGAEYNLCLTVFFFTYCFFEIPSNLLLKKLRPSVNITQFNPPTIHVANYTEIRYTCLPSWFYGGLAPFA